MLVYSNWTITFDHGGASAFVLATAGDWLDDEFALPWTQQTTTSKPKGATGAKSYGRNAMETTLTLAVYKDHATHAAARAWMLAHAAALPMGSAAVRFTVTGGASSYSLADAVIGGGDVRMVTGTGAIRTRASYNITGGRISVIP